LNWTILTSAVAVTLRPGLGFGFRVTPQRRVKRRERPFSSYTTKRVKRRQQPNNKTKKEKKEKSSKLLESRKRQQFPFFSSLKKIKNNQIHFL